MKRLFSIKIYGEYLKITLQYDTGSTIFSRLRYLQNVGDFIYDLKIFIDDRIIYDASSYPNDFHVELNGNFAYNQDISQILDLTFGMVKVITLIVPNAYHLKEGMHEVTFKFRKTKFMFYTKFTYIDGTLDFPPSSMIEPIRQQAKDLISNQENAKKYFIKMGKIATIIGVLVYMSISIFLLAITIRVALDPVARQLDVAFSSALAFIVWTLLGLAIFLYVKLIKYN